MSINERNQFEDFLFKHDEVAWSATLAELLHEIHEVDLNATQIWFKFYPLTLWTALAHAVDKQELVRKLLLQGTYDLKDQIDSSHAFLYGHRYWPDVKKEVETNASTFQEYEGVTVAGEIRKLATTVAQRVKADASLLTGITAVAFMTVLQVGLENFASAPGNVSVSTKLKRMTPDDVLKSRAQDDSQGLFGFLKTVDKEWTITFDESDPRARFKLINEEEIASAAARDQSQDWRARDTRCIEGPIPVECRSASCGTCWVGVLGGAEKLTEVKVREAKMIKEFGYIETDEPKPIIRLACMAQGTGAVSIVIPPWNGIFGKPLKTQEREATEVNAEIMETLSANGVAS